MLQAVAPETFQLSVEDSPGVMLGGLALKELITGAWPRGTQPIIKIAAAIRTRHSGNKNLFIS
jgi:hypothetical protein